MVQPFMLSLKSYFEVSWEIIKWSWCNQYRVENTIKNFTCKNMHIHANDGKEKVKVNDVFFTEARWQLIIFQIFTMNVYYFFSPALWRYDGQIKTVYLKVYSTMLDTCTHCEMMELPSVHIIETLRNPGNFLGSNMWAQQNRTAWEHWWVLLGTPSPPLCWIFFPHDLQVCWTSPSSGLGYTRLCSNVWGLEVCLPHNCAGTTLPSCHVLFVV